MSCATEHGNATVLSMLLGNQTYISKYLHECLDVSSLCLDCSAPDRPQFSRKARELVVFMRHQVLIEAQEAEGVQETVYADSVSSGT
jgi:hypothetical protein